MSATEPSDKNFYVKENIYDFRVYYNEKGYILIKYEYEWYWGFINGPYHKQLQKGSCSDQNTFETTIAGPNNFEFKITGDKTKVIFTCKETPFQFIYKRNSELESFVKSQMKDTNVWKFSKKWKCAEYLFYCEETMEYFVSNAPALTYSYDFQIFRGKPFAMKKINGKIQVERFRDGGTTIIQFFDENEKIDIFSPSPMNRNSLSTVKINDKVYNLKIVLPRNDTTHEEYGEKIREFCQQFLGMNVEYWNYPQKFYTHFSPNGILVNHVEEAS